MEAHVRGMPPPAMEGEAEPADYSFAVEYRGPPVPYEIPRAVPIEIERIPVAHVASPSALPDHLLPLPVAQPLPSPAPLKTPTKCPHPPPTDLAATSPTSVIENHAIMDGPDRSRELSDGVESSGAVGLSSDLRESGDTVPDRVSTDSALSSEFGSRSSLSAYEAPELETQGRRPPLVTFRDSADSTEPTSPAAREELEPRVKKGVCYRCLKGNWFTEKEACLVCNAKYCSGCVLRAMGSMPEGRKCVACIGASIQESNRGKLGKCSRMLKRLLSLLEVQQAMRAEKSCEANQLRAEEVHVNGKMLSLDEMILLQSCPNPPTKLKPGLYWYDKVSGLWGKEGQKPHKIISPNLNIGGSLMRNASNGNTGILINNREITKNELQMLKWARVQCAGNPHFWLNPDGSYQEEGQKKIKGKIWGRPGIKLICSILSLPTPSKAVNPFDEEANMISRAVPDYLEQRTLQKLLLLGYDGSGMSTIYKQARFLYKDVSFSEEERENIKLMIQSNVYTYLGILLEGRERFEESLAVKRKSQENCSSDARNTELSKCDGVTEYSIGPRLKEFSDWLLKVMATGNLEAIFPAATREYAPIVEELWNDAAIQATYNRRNELELLPSVASYFLERVVDISKVDYEPTHMDILYAEGVTSSNGLVSVDFSFPQSPCDWNDLDVADQQDKLLRYQLIKVHARGLGENCKWLGMFEDVRIIIFCIAMSDYNECYVDAKGIVINRMMESKKLFESIVTNETFDQIDFLLILNKFDLLEQKIDSAPLTLCEWFDDFNPVVSRHRPNNSNLGNGATMAQQAFYYIAVKFKRLFFSLTGRKLYVTMANGLDSDSVDAALRYAREILKWEEEKHLEYGTSDLSGHSTEPSSFSH